MEIEQTNAPAVNNFDKTKRFRAWCFTSNNYTDEDELLIYSLVEHCSYVIVGRETAPTTGTPHYQGFIYFDNPRTFSGVLKLLPDGTHLEPKYRESTFKQASDYCRKGGDFFENGTLPMDQQGKGDAGKLSSEQRWELAKLGDFESLPPEHYPLYRAIYSEFRVVSDRNELTNYWICGPSGCGKSRYVRDTYGPGTELGGDLGFYTKMMNKWWDGYRDEDVVLMDDFDPDHGKYLGYFLKIWSDHYAFNAEIKRGFVRLRPLIFVITSQYPIHRCFHEPETIEAITRRFQVIQLAPFPQVPQYAQNFNPPQNLNFNPHN